MAEASALPSMNDLKMVSLPQYLFEIDSKLQWIITGSITYGDLLGVAPFPNTIDVVKITGQTIKDMLEFSVHDYDPSALEPFGGFLQVSGNFFTFENPY